MTGQVHLTKEGHVAVLTLDNPPLNIITSPMRPLIMKGLRSAAEDPDVRCVVLTGAGDRSFCAGADLGEEADLTPDTVRQFLDDDCEIFDGLEDLPVPVIAAVNGHCMGGGFEVALACDIRIVADDAKLCGAGVKVGLVVSTTRLTRLAGPGVAKDVLLTGRTFTGAEAYQLSIASAAVPRAEVGSSDRQSCAPCCAANQDRHPRGSPAALRGGDEPRARPLRGTVGNRGP